MDARVSAERIRILANWIKELNMIRKLIEKHFSKILIGLFAFSLVSCSTIEKDVSLVTGNNVSPTTVYVAANAFDAAKRTATVYLNLPLCGATPCRTSGISKSVYSALVAGTPIRSQLEALINAGNGNSPVSTSIYNSLTAIISTINADVGA